MAVKRLANVKVQYDDGTGVLASSYRLFFYAAGSSTKQNTYNSSTGSVANSNPVVLNALGEPAVEIWLTAGLTYKMGLAIPGTDDPPASFVWTEDNISGVNDTTTTLDEWVNPGLTPTFVSATSFTLSGDQTSAFHVGRRVKTTNSGGTVYSTIITSVFGALTTITVVNDSGTLDAGLSAVSYGLQAATNPSEPLLLDTFPLRSGSADKTKKVRIEVDGLTTGTTRVLTVQDSDQTLVGLTTTDVLTNKTLTSPTINGATLSGTLAGTPTFSGVANFSATGTHTFSGPLDISGASAGQVKFPAAQNASANANTLDDYEEGTWTPGVGGSATYTAQTGLYTKVGRIVHLQGRLVINAIGTGSPSQFSGAPFTSAALAQAIPVTYFNTSATAVNWLGSFINASNTLFDMHGTTAAQVSSVLTNVFGNSADIIFGGSYST